MKMMNTIILATFVTAFAFSSSSKANAKLEMNTQIMVWHDKFLSRATERTLGNIKHYSLCHFSFISFVAQASVNKPVLESVKNGEFEILEHDYRNGCTFMLESDDEIDFSDFGMRQAQMIPSWFYVDERGAKESYKFYNVFPMPEQVFESSWKRLNNKLLCEAKQEPVQLTTIVLDVLRDRKMFEKHGVLYPSKIVQLHHFRESKETTAYYLDVKENKLSRIHNHASLIKLLRENGHLEPYSIKDLGMRQEKNQIHLLPNILPDDIVDPGRNMGIGRLASNSANKKQFTRFRRNGCRL